MWKEEEAQEDKEAQAEEKTQEDAPQEVDWIAEQQNKPEISLLLENEHFIHFINTLEKICAWRISRMSRS